jgi:hypothetical protein
VRLNKNREFLEPRLLREQEYEASRMKLEFLCWDDEAPSRWVSRAECFFKYHHTPNYLIFL